MASSSFFSGIEATGKRRKVSESSRLFDVFINHRRPDVKLTLASQLYNCLKKLGIGVFLDSQEKELRNSFPSTIETAIRSAKVHIAIFSKTYADSPWCLAELALMLESNAKIIPVFYQVKPTDLRHIEKGVYAGAFKRYEEKGRYLEKLSQWKEALQSLSFVAGEEFDSFSDCETILVAVQAEVRRKTLLHVAEYPVGLSNVVVDDDDLVQDFENQCELKKGEDQVKVVGIFGMGGAGKTTLAKELFNRKMVDYSKACFLFDVREASATNLPSLQLKLLAELFGKEHPSFASAEDGTSYLRDCIQRSSNLSLLIVVDGIDHVQQLNSLLVKDILNKSANTLIIVTTRDVGVLISAGISVGYNLKGMNRHYGMELFCWHAFGQPHPLCGYEALVDDFVDLCGGLPLSLQVLGRHVHGRPPRYWKLQLLKAGKMLHGDVKKRLKISFDALDDEEKQIFMDIACFFGGKSIDTAVKVWEASGWNAEDALETLKDKCLVEEIWQGDDLVLRMHDHLRDLGREMALELSHPPRLWRPQDLKSLESKGSKYILNRTNIRCFHSFHDESMDFQVTFFLGQSDNFDEPSASLLYLVLEGDMSELSSFPSWIPLQNLLYLEINNGLFETLWDDNIQAPSRLKELVIFSTEFDEFPDFSGMSDSLENVSLESLEKLQISRDNYVSRIFVSGTRCPSLESVTLEGMGNLKEVNLRSVKALKSLSIIDCEELKILKKTSYPTNLVLLEIRDCPEIEELKLAHLSCLERIVIRYCKHLKRVIGIPNLGKLVELEIEGCTKLEFDHLCHSGMSCLRRMTFDTQVKVKYFKLDSCQNLKELQFDCEELVELEIEGCRKLEFDHLFLSGMSCLRRMTFDRQVKVKYFKLYSCQNLKEIQFGCEELVDLSIRHCPELVTLPVLEGPSCLERITIDGCEKLECVELIGCQNLKSVSANIEITQLHIVDCRELVELQCIDEQGYVTSL